ESCPLQARKPKPPGPAGPGGFALLGTAAAVNFNRCGTSPRRDDGALRVQRWRRDDRRRHEQKIPKRPARSFALTVDARVIGGRTSLGFRALTTERKVRDDGTKDRHGS